MPRKTFRQFLFNKVKENLRSFTIFIENETYFTWNKVLSNCYGVPLDRQANGNGLHWKVVNYTDGNLTSNLSISKWHIPKKDGQSKLHIQSKEAGNFLPAHYVDNFLPKLFEEVHKHQDNKVKDIQTEPVNLKCGECEIDCKTKSLCTSIITH